MDLKTSKAIFSLIATLCLLLSTALSAPTDDLTADELEQAQLDRGEDRRATWLETRNLEENFKQLVYLSMQELASEGLVNPEVLTGETTVDKRGRHQGFCFRKTRSGRFLPYICWKNGSR